MAPQRAEGVPGPAEFAAVTSIQYWVFTLRPVMTQLSAPVVVQFATAVPPVAWVNARAVYEVTGAPPLLVGAVQTTETVRSETVAEVIVGALGGVGLSVVACVRDDAALVPTAFCATTDTQYVVPFASPAMTQERVPVVEQLATAVPPVDALNAVAV